MSILTEPHLLDGARWKNKRVGLLGGSFNPPHEGHVHISLAALRGLELDAVWWLVTPQNPLKDLKPLLLDERISLSKNLITHPDILVTGIENDLGTTATYRTVRLLKSRFAKTDFIWISGMDNAHSLHSWSRWRDLLAEVPMVHITRSPARSLVQNCPVRMYEKQRHVVINKAGRFPLNPGTTYWMMQKKMVNISSSEIRNKTIKTAA